MVSHLVCMPSLGIAVVAAKAFDTLCGKFHHGFLGGNKDVGVGETNNLPAVSLLDVSRNQLAVFGTLHGNTVAVETIGYDGEVLNKNYVGVVEGQPFLRLIKRAMVQQAKKERVIFRERLNIRVGQKSGIVMRCKRLSAHFCVGRRL